MKKYRSLIIDDEPLARKRVGQLIDQNAAAIDVVGEAESGSVAIELIKKERPDLLFLDIRLTDMDAFEVLKQIDYPPLIIFTTAYAEYSLQAFETICIDYLVKPISQERFDKAIEKLSVLKEKRQDLEVFQSQLNVIKSSIKKPEQTYLAVNSGNKINLLDYKDISYINADDKYVEVFDVDGKKYFIDKTLQKMEEVLPSYFVRIHRSTIININNIKEISKYFKGRYLVSMKDNNKSNHVTSDGYKDNFKIILGL